MLDLKFHVNRKSPSGKLGLPINKY